MKKILFICLAIISLKSFSQETIINDKNAEVRNVETFSAIKVAGSIDVYLSQGNSDAVAVSASEVKYRDKIKTEVTNGTLKIFFDGDKLSWNIGNKKLKAYVSFREIHSLEATGASTFKINGTISGTNLDVKLTGASDLMGDVKFSKLIAYINGASQVKISGRVDNIDINASGASDVKGYDLAADDCSVKATGASDIRITVNKEISVNATGASSIVYKGDAVMTNVHTTGASNVSKKN
ncbi:MAG: head GIN domain-containing protein [Ginsengibacter sp.]